MNNLFFWIIVCSWLIPMGIRMYNRSRQRGINNFPPNPPGQYNPGPTNPSQYNPGQYNPGQYQPGQYQPGQYQPGRYDPRPYDPSEYGDQYSPGQYNPSQYSPGQNNPGPYNPTQPPVVFPSEPQRPVATPAPHAAPPSSSASLPDSSSQPHGYRARKLAELDQQFSDGKIAMEDYMKLRQEIMNG